MITRGGAGDLVEALDGPWHSLARLAEAGTFQDVPAFQDLPGFALDVSF